MRKYFRLLLTGVFLVFACSLTAQDKPVSGVVIADDDNTPLRDVTVTIKGTDNRTKTNEAGRFTINARPGQVLLFTFVDYARQEIVIGAGNTYNLRMVPSQKELGEVVVTTYGSRTNKRQLATQVQEIKGEEIASTQRENFINSLSGRVAGATITPSSGAPGASSQIVLRGATSIGGNNQPLFVVDGVPYDNQTLNQENLAAGTVGFANRNSDYGNRAADINPDDIESVTILKGPEATALYGSDGASGAVIITTRKGKSGKGTVTYDNSFRFEKLYMFPETQRVYARGNNGVSNPISTISPYAIGEQFAYFGAKYPEGTKFYDNLEAFFQPGFMQKHNLNVEGGSETSTYRLSANYTDQKGIIPNTAFERLSLRFGGTAKISPKFNVLTSVNYVTSITDKASKGPGGFLLSLLNYPADLDIRDYKNPDGSRKPVRGASLTAEFDNPLWDVEKNRAQDKVDRVTTNITLNYDPFKWLNLGLISGLDVYSQTGDFIVHPQSRSGVTANGFLSLYTQNTKNFSNVGRVTIRKKVGSFSNTAILGFANDDNKTRIESQKGERFYEQNFKSINNTDPLSRDAKTTVLNTRKVRFFGNYTLGYNNLAYLTFAGSREGNSTLGSRAVEKDQFYNFGSVSGSFVFSDLKVFEKADKWFNYGKLRASYGSTGKGPASPYIIDYTFQTQITTGGGYAYGVTGNNFFLKPERTTNLELGFELKFLDNRLTIDATRYDLESKDQILAARSSYGTGYVIKYFNGGVIENKGYEVIVTGNPIRSKNFNWDVTVNYDRNRGKILQMPKDLPTYYDSDTWVFGNLRSQAYQGAFTGNLSGFFNERNAAGNIIVSGVTGLATRSLDFGIVGDRQPDYKVGLINTLTYKNVSLSFNLDFRKGGDVWNGNEYFLFVTGGSTKTLNRENLIIVQGVLNDGLQNTSNPTRNTITVSPLYRSDYYGTGTATEADFIESVDWMRLRDATINYKLSQKLLKRQKFLKAASVFVTGTDLFIVTNYTGADPSVNANTASNRGYGGAGIDYGAISTPRAISFGIKAQF